MRLGITQPAPSDKSIDVSTQAMSAKRTIVKAPYSLGVISPVKF
jgi:hypothetical protein